MTVPQSLLLLLTVALAICFPLFLGHALAAHSMQWGIIAFACLAISGALFWVNVKLIRPRDTHH
jgi:hypothetical protein